jgi:spermidine synthase
MTSLPKQLSSFQRETLFADGFQRETGPEQMQEQKIIDRVRRIEQRRFAEVRPRVCEDGDRISLQFQIGEIQSEMLANDPNFLLLSYTRAMMAFLLFYRVPRRIAIIGLGGGSMPKWCYQQLPAADITVVEISPMVISLREQFYIPADDYRFRVICGDGADYVASTEDLPEVLFVDGFDIHGQPPQLCSEEFYEDCYRALAPDGLMVVNLCDTDDQPAVDRIKSAFDDRVLIAVPEDGENKIVFAIKGRRLRIEDEPTGELVKRLQAADQLDNSLAQS